MAVTNPAAFLQNAGATHTAEITRNAIGAFQAGPRTASSLVPRGGVHPHLGGALAVTQNGSPNMTVNVANGMIAVPGTEGTSQGQYICMAPTTTNLAITAAHATLPRIDIVVAKVEDAAYSGANNQWSLAVVTGTAAASPTAPAAPNNSITLATVAVAAAATQILNANITDTRPYSSVGIIYVKDVASLPSPAMGGMVAYVKSTGQLSTYNENTTTWQNSSGAQFLQRVIFTSSSTFTKATYPGLRKVLVRVQGGGGAGGGAASPAAGNSAMGGGGGGGGYAESWLDASSLAASVTITVGAGGTGVSAADGNNGSSSSFGATVVAGGGFGGVTRAASSSPFGTQGGQGGVGTAGDLLLSGTAGEQGWGDGQLGISGSGGASQMGGGGRGQRTIAGSASFAGASGGNYGGGGSGALTSAAGAAVAGGSGAGGVIIVDCYV